MTDQHPQQEYIITEDQLSVLTDPHRGYSEYRSELKKIRSRPHTPAAPATESKFTCWRGDCKLHDDCIHSYGQEYPPCVDACAMQARKAEHEQVLDAIGKEICDRFHLKPRPYDPNDCEIPQIGLDELAEIIDAARESLRGGAP